MIARKLFSLGFAAALLTAFGCSSGGDGGMTPPALACNSGGGAATANAVTMTCGGATDSTTEQVDVVMDGPAPGTANTTLRGLNFDVKFLESNLKFVGWSTTTPPFVPDALVDVAPSDPPELHVVVAIQQKRDVINPMEVGAGQHVVLSLFFQRVAGATFSRTPLTFVNFEATDASTAITFASDLELSYQ